MRINISLTPMRMVIEDGDRFTSVRLDPDEARALRDDLTDALDRMCETCHGTGEARSGSDCPDCHGRGEVLEAPEDEGTGR